MLRSRYSAGAVAASLVVTFVANTAMAAVRHSAVLFRVADADAVRRYALDGAV